MGHNLFGVDIAGLVATHIGPGLHEAVLTKFTAGTAPERLTSAPSQTPVPYTCRGMWIDYDVSKVDGVLVLVGDKKALLIGDTLPAGIIPEGENTITINGETRVVIRIEGTDPAAATYTVQCRDRAGVNGT